MSGRKMLRWGMVILTFACAPFAPAAEVDLALVLAVDVSSSMDETELKLQRAGYVAAITDPLVLAAIASGATGRVAVAYMEWAGPEYQSVAVPWQVIDGAEAAQRFADALAARPLLRQTDTSISAALIAASGLITASGIRTSRRVIDISGDGPNTAGPPVAPVRDRLVAEGLVINGLPLILDPAPTDAPAEGDLETYFRDCVTGGPAAFVLPVRARDGLVAAIRRKLVLEIATAQFRVVPARAVIVPPRADCTMGQKNFYE